MNVKQLSITVIGAPFIKAKLTVMFMSELDVARKYTITFPPV